MTVLFLTQRLPYAPNRGDRIRAYYLMREMSRFADVYVSALVHDDGEASKAEQMPFARGVAVARVSRARNSLRALARLSSATPLTHLLLDSPEMRPNLSAQVAAHPPDLVVAYCSGVARFALEPPLADRPLVLDMVDVDSVKWRELAARTRGPLRWVYRREASTLRAFERTVVARAATTLVVNNREREALREIAPDGRICTVENGIDLEMFAPLAPPAETPTVVFCGVMNYAPNAEGIRWFADRVWPAVRSVVPGATFTVVGDAPPRSIRRLALADPSISVTGRVDTVAPYLWRAAVAIAPLWIARGLQNKVLEALAAGLPVVVTPTVLEGLPAEARSGCVTAHDAGAFADAVVRLLRTSPQQRRTLARGARLELLGWPGRLAPVEQVLRSAAGMTSS